MMLDLSKYVLTKASEMNSASELQKRIKDIAQGFNEPKPYLNAVISVYQMLSLLDYSVQDIKNAIPTYANNFPELKLFMKSNDFNSDSFWSGLDGIEKFALPETVELVESIKLDIEKKANDNSKKKAF